MAEKIKIFELDIDVDAAIASQSKLKDTLDASRESLKRMKKQGETSSEQYVELEATVKNLSREYNASQTQLGKLINLQGKEIKTVKQGEAALTIINKEWSKQASLFGVNSKEADLLAKKHAELKERTNNLRKSIGDTSTNIGNYAEGMKEALGSTTLLGRAQQFVTQVMQVASPVFKAIRSDLSIIRKDYVKATSGMKGYTTAQKAATIATNLGSAALRIFKLALASTGIGLIVIALGSLVAWFTKTQKGIDLVNTVMAALGAGIDVVIDRFAKLGGGIAKFLSGDFSGGIDDITSSFSGMGDEMAREIELGAKLERQLQKLTREETLLNFRRAAANTTLKELKKISEDTSKSTEERLDAAKKIEKIETELAQAELKNAESQLNNKLGKLKADEKTLELLDKLKKGTAEYDEVLNSIGQSNSTDEDVQELLDLFTKAEEKQQASFEKRTENQNKLNTLLEEEKRKQEAASKAAIKAREDQIAAAQKATDAAIKESKTRLELFIEENERKADTLQKGLELEEQIRDRRLAILEEEKEAGKLTTTEYELEKLQIKNEFLDQQAALTKEYADKEKEAKAIALQESRDLEEQEKARKITDLENKREIEAGNFEAQLEIEKQRLEIQRQQELAEAEKTGADKALINEKYAQIEKDIEAEKQSFKLSIASQTFANLATILGKESAAGKAAAVAQTTIDTYQAATAAYKAMAGIPVIGPALGAIAAAAAVASGIANVKKIVSTKEPQIPRAAKGATLRGPSHSGGGINLYDDNGRPVVNAEGDENIYVLNKRASGLINSLSYMNQSTGGIPLTQATTFAAAGGMIQTRNTSVSNPQSLIDYDILAMKMAEANRSLPRPVVAVEDINSGQNNYADVVNGANI